ncbi:MAG: hypothetical protein Q8L87_13005, partial [Anaerolineales bacterium]|nr:hypothetical protein [Anaerolineales bacterium]
ADYCTARHVLPAPVPQAQVSSSKDLSCERQMGCQSTRNVNIAVLKYALQKIGMQTLVCPGIAGVQASHVRNGVESLPTFEQNQEILQSALTTFACAPVRGWFQQFQI